MICLKVEVIGSRNPGTCPIDQTPEYPGSRVVAHGAPAGDRWLVDIIVMKLNHLNLTVINPIETQDFLKKYFHLRPMGKANEHIAFLTDDSEMALTLTNVRLGMETEVKYPVNFHIGFGQESEARVNEINARLKMDGFDVPAPSKQHGAWTFYFTAPGGFTIEVLSPIDRDKSEPQSEGDRQSG